MRGEMECVDESVLRVGERDWVKSTGAGFSLEMMRLFLRFKALCR